MLNLSTSVNKKQKRQEGRRWMKRNRMCPSNWFNINQFNRLYSTTLYTLKASSLSSSYPKWYSKWKWRVERVKKKPQCLPKLDKPINHTHPPATYNSLSCLLACSQCRSSFQHCNYMFDINDRERESFTFSHAYCINFSVV